MHRASCVYGDAGQDCHGLLQSQAKNIEQFGPVTVPHDAVAMVPSGGLCLLASTCIDETAIGVRRPFLLCLPRLPSSRIQPGAADQVELERERYLKEIDGQMVDLYTLENKSGMVVKITNWGAKVQQILVPDKEGVLGDVALGYDSIDQLQAGQSSMGAFIGRYANRIGQAKFTLNGQEYKLAANNGANSLHGGQKGSRFVVFDAKPIDDATVQMSQADRRCHGADELCVQGGRGGLSGYGTSERGLFGHRQE
jgi:Aldose 1-epimerase